MVHDDCTLAQLQLPCRYLVSGCWTREVPSRLANRQKRPAVWVGSVLIPDSGEYSAVPSRLTPSLPHCVKLPG